MLVYVRSLCVRLLLRFALHTQHLIFPRLSAGTRVSAAFQLGTKYYPGVISGVSEGWNYSVDYDDGDHEDHLPPECAYIV